MLPCEFKEINEWQYLGKNFLWKSFQPPSDPVLRAPEGTVEISGRTLSTPREELQVWRLDQSLCA